MVTSGKLVQKKKKTLLMSSCLTSKLLVRSLVKVTPEFYTEKGVLISLMYQSINCSCFFFSP